MRVIEKYFQLETSLDPIDKYVNHYDDIGLSVKKTGTNSLKFVDDEINYMDDYQFKMALLNARGDHQQWIKIVEKGLEQWRDSFIDLTD